MIRNIFIFILAIIFITLVILYSYKMLSVPKLIKVPLNSIKQELSLKNSGQSSQTADKDNIPTEKVEPIIKNCIEQNPEVIINSLEKMRKQKVIKPTEDTSEYIKNNKEKIINSGNPPYIGNMNGDISIVLFYDYSCSFCKSAHVELNKLIKSDKNVKVILRPIGILGQSSLFAAKTILATHKVSDTTWPEIHDNLMKLHFLDKNSIKELVQNYGLDYLIIENEINSYTIKKLISQNYELAKSLNISGTPTYVINDIFIAGFINEDQLKQIVTQLRIKNNSLLNEQSKDTKQESNSSGNE